MAQPDGTTPIKRGRCIIWHPAHKPPRPELVAGFNRPPFRVFKAADPFRAMATICSWSEACRPQPGESTILLLVEPSELPDLRAFLDAREHYAAAAEVWVYESAGMTPLRKASAAEVARWRAAPESSAPPQPVPSVRTAPSLATPALTPALRLAGDGPLPPERRVEPLDGETPSPVPDVKPKAPAADAARPSPDTPPPRPAPATLLTDDELAMLLALDVPSRKP